MVFIAPLPSALAWCIKSSLARQGLLLSLPFLCLLLCARISPPTSLFWLVHFEPSWSMFLPLLLSRFPLPPTFSGFPEERSLPMFALCRTSPSNCWLFSSIQFCGSGAGNHLAALCSRAVNCLPAEKDLWKPIMIGVNNLTLVNIFSKTCSPIRNTRRCQLSLSLICMYSFWNSDWSSAQKWINVL